MVCDRYGPELVDELEARVHSGEILKGERDELETARVVAPGEIVVHEATEVVTPLHRHPADDVGLELAEQLAPNIDETGAPGREEPFLRSAGENVDVTCAHVQRERSQPLDCVDHEVRAAGSTGASDRLEIDGVAAGEANPRDGHGANGGILELAPERHLVHGAVTGRDAAID